MAGPPIIGRGERTALQILSEVYRLGYKPTRCLERGESGIYTQVPLPMMVAPEYSGSMSPLFQKSTVDIAVVVPGGTRVAVYVNGRDHNGWRKSRRDVTRYRLLIQNGWKLLVLPYYECPELFRDVVNAESRAEVRGMMRPAAAYGLPAGAGGEPPASDSEP